MNFYPIQPFHLVTYSPWPIFVSFDLLFFAITGVIYFNHTYSIIGSSSFPVLLSFINLLFGVFMWFRDIITEATYLGDHTTYIQHGLILGFYLFLVTEIFFFIGAFWSFFHSALSPVVEIGSIWPPVGIEAIYPFDLPLLNTILLLSSGISVTYAHHYMIGKSRFNTIIGFLFTILFAVVFIYCQYIEYSNSTFNISDSVFGTTFYFITGTHGIHVILGTILLSISLYRIYSYQVTNSHHLGVESAIIYWHFVDVVWLFVFIFVYWWAYLFIIPLFIYNYLIY